MKTRYSILIAAFLLVFFSGLSLTSAADPYFVSMTPLGAPPATCSTTDFYIPIHVSYHLPDDLPVLPAREENILNGVSLGISLNGFGYAGTDEGDSSEVAGADSGFPVASLPYTYQRIFVFSIDNTPISRVTFDLSCDAGGNVTSFDVTSVNYTSATLPAPPLPSTFVLRTIICDTPLYESAGGQPVSGGAAVTSGQTWYVNPIPVDAGSISWTELFDSSYHNGWLPTSCVGGAPAGY